ncbi:MAG: tRNA pseudouridine(38-40) synthase TruA, partial [Deltaproteobacteria bacterium]|nr:tRNA pseudouridine(38-40) synthase TruA [Deltaproteobacteria bacterium]
QMCIRDRAYDGSNFYGWAKQPGLRTVQGVLEEKISAFAAHPVSTRAAGRTDRGVHALGQVVAFDTHLSLPPQAWLRGVNRLLPEDLVIRAVDFVEIGYEPRHDTIDKTYRYLLLIDSERDPLLRHRAWFLPPQFWHPALRHSPSRFTFRLDIEAMRKAATLFVGTHDFRAFRAEDDHRENSIRTIYSLTIDPDWNGDPRLVAITVRGNAFMKHMVRIIVGTLVEVGRGRMLPESVSALLGPQAKRNQAGPTAPPEGLTLLSVCLGRSGSLPTE